MSVDSELHERAQGIAANSINNNPTGLEWRNDQLISISTGRILAMIEIKGAFCDVLMNGAVVAQFVSSEQAKRWVEQQNL